MCFRSRRPGPVFACLSSCLLLGLSVNARAQSSICGVNVGAPIWNGSILFTDALAADIASSGCRRVRVNFRIDGNSTWTPAHLAKYDTIIQTARSHNLQVLGIICYEAVAGGQADWNQNYSTTGLNAYTYQFADNAWVLINRYKNDVKLFEIWNEPDCWSVNPATNPLTPGCYYIWPKNYANLLAETYKKCITAGGADFFAANGVSLVTGGLFAHDIGGSFSTSRSYMSNVYNQNSIWNAFQSVTGRRYPWDYFGYHFYLNQGEAVSTSELLAYFDDIRALKAGKTDSSPFLLTEFGWMSSAVGLTLQANNLRDTYDWLKTQPDILTGYWYQWNDGDGGWGLVYGIGSPKPSYYEFAKQCGQVPAPVAQFSAQPVSGRAPLSVQFTNLSTGAISGYEWHFGDGHTSTQANPSNTYAASGTYTVTLAATGPGGTNSETKAGFISVLLPRVPADLDDDGDVDGKDVDRFGQCMTGSGYTAIPVGCGTGTASVPPPTVGWEGASSLDGLSASIRADDLVNGASGTVESGGFHGATPGGTAGGLIDLTDGVGGANVETVLQDYPGGDPPNSADPFNRALQVRYDFAAPKDISHIHVFAANVTSPGDGRVFQNYDLEYRQAGDAAFKTLVRNVTTGPFGRSNGLPNTDPNYLGATLTRVQGDNDGPAAINVDSLRFILYPVANMGGLFMDEFEAGETGDGDGLREAFVSSIIKEIDVFEWAGALPPAANIADLDGDGDADQADFAILQICLSGTDILADADCW